MFCDWANAENKYVTWFKFVHFCFFLPSWFDIELHSFRADQEVRLMKGQRRQAAAGWAEDSASRDAMQAAVPGKEAYARNVGGKQACMHRHIFMHALVIHKLFTEQTHEPKICKHKCKNWTGTCIQGFQLHTERVHAHTHVTYANKLQRLHGMWQMPSSPAHILFPDRTRPRLLTQQQQQHMRKMTLKYHI